MDRKKIIITAVMVNAALLIVLFITAMTTKDESISQSANIAAHEIRPEIIEIPSQTATVVSAPPLAPLFALPPQIELEKPVVTPVIAATPTPVTPPKPETPAVLEVEVQKGDTLEKIAKAYHTRVDMIIKLNQLPSSFLKVGQKLKIPSEKTLDLPVLRQSPEYYVMKVGDNPWSIAMKHHMKVDELLKINGLNEKSARKLKPGDRLRIK